MVSIIIPAYNAAAVIERCLTSVLRQDYKYWETLVVNDCSSDNTKYLVEDIIKQNPECVIRCIDLTSNCGVAHARNTGIRVSKGDYLFFLDADDEIYPSTLSYLVSEIKDYDMAIGGHDVTSNGPTKHSPMIIRESQGFIGRDVIKGFSDGCWHVMPWNKLIKKTFLTDNQLYFPESLRFHEDYVWNVFCACKAKKIRLVAEQTYNYIVNADSITSRLTIERDLKGYISAFNAIAAFYRETGLCKETAEYLLLEGKKSGVMYSLLQIGETRLYDTYYKDFRESCIISPFVAWKSQIITARYFIRDVHYLLPIRLGKAYKKCFYWLLYKFRGKTIKGSIWQ